MKRKALKGLPIAAVIASIGSLSEAQFNELKNSIFSQDVFDTSLERVEPLAVKMGISADDVKTIIGLLDFLYNELHDTSVDVISIDNSIDDILNTLREGESYNIYISNDTEKLVKPRLAGLLEHNDFVEIYEKSKNARSGFLPAAQKFRTFVDLRPIYSKDRRSIVSFVPLVQIKAEIDDSDTEFPDVVFQVDTRGLRALKEAVDSALHKLDVISKDQSFSSRLNER